jgi:hypothetical protein
MIQIMGLRKVGTEKPQQFELIYKDLKKNSDKGYLMTTKYDTESALRTVLNGCGMAESTINTLFQRAK